MIILLHLYKLNISSLTEPKLYATEVILYWHLRPHVILIFSPMAEITQSIFFCTFSFKLMWHKLSNTYKWTHCMLKNISRVNMKYFAISSQKGDNYDIWHINPFTPRKIRIRIYWPLSCWTRIYPAFANSVDPDQLASEEANWSGSALFTI